MRCYVTPEYYYGISYRNQVVLASELEVLTYGEYVARKFLKPFDGMMKSGKEQKKIQTSSGKIAWFEWEKELLASVSINKWLKKSDKDKVGCWLPLSHISGWSLFWSSFVCGSLITFGNSLGYVNRCSIVNTQYYRLKYWGKKKNIQILLGAGKTDEACDQSYGATETWAANWIKKPHLKSRLLVYKSGKMLSNQELLLRNWMVCIQKGLWIRIGDIGCLTKQGVWIQSRTDLAYKRAGRSIFIWQIEEAIKNVNEKPIEVIVIAKEDVEMGVKWIAFVDCSKWPPQMPKEKYWQPDVVRRMPKYDGIKPVRGKLSRE
jgi:acyl-CoA synthetase (AMP-forming)/AMP-acid ligase II|uniref:O-succinylbenzoic acid-CoA ligase n=1 Tax=Cyanidiaceae sp. MX-AZ01 TaxID=1503164 RepID=A0A060A8J1_9RHOD|nr:o-succinylbenzoic acid-CoA ligase [Cyanidiaceae sp. MX-AZ01]